MKRFYCTICQRVKRVRQYPSNITSEHADKVIARTGTCARHSDSFTSANRAQSDARIKVRKGA